MSAAWRLFTPCAGADSLLEAVSVAAKSAAPGDVILFSPACSSVDQSLDDNIQGVAFCAAVNSLDGAARSPSHNGNNDKPENGVE
jgi:UDP-N-acetylmuramoylalanine--D-glutamate ligase